MWYIYGKVYNLSSFLNKHPGGKNILSQTKNLGDLTAVFESYHAFSDFEMIKNKLSTFEIHPDKKEIINSLVNGKSIDKFEQYDFRNYHELIKEVKQVLPNRKSIKANTTLFLQLVSFFILYCFFFWIAMLSQNDIVTKSICSFVAGTLSSLLLFNLLHTGSHYGLFLNPTLNELLSTIINSWLLWSHIKWFYHHIIYHHSFTSDEYRDPDYKHFGPFAKKFENDHTNKFKYFVKNQFRLIPYLAIVFPGVFVSQSLSYFTSIANTLIFSKKSFIPNHVQIINKWEILISLVKIYCISKGSFFPIVIYFITLNFFWHINIVGDHDTYETNIINHYKGYDWLKLQICNSGNFQTHSMFWTYAFGGINFQIEHHLFPSVCHIHYPLISEIVRKYCQTNNIPYVCHTNVLTAYQSFLKNLKFISINSN